MARKTKEVDHLSIVRNHLAQWYYEEVRSLADAAIEACVGRLVTEPTKEDLSVVPPKERASARASFQPYRRAKGVYKVRESELERMELGEAYQEREHGVDRREFLQDWVDQAIDGHEFVIYTYQAKCVCLASDNEEAYVGALDGESPVTPEQKAYFALQADVWEALEARSDEWEGEDPEPEPESNPAHDPGCPNCPCGCQADFSDDEPDDSADRIAAEHVDLPSCALAMGCLCAAHAGGLGSDEPCSATEVK